MIVLELDPQLAAHVALALRAHREALARNGFARPEGLLDLEAAFRRAATSGQERPSADSEPVVVPAARHRQAHELVSPQQAAAELGVSTRTLRRWLAAGDLAAVTVGGRRRIARAELERFADLRAEDAA